MTVWQCGDASFTIGEVDFDGVLIVDHSPHVVDDTDWGHRGRAFAMGYMKALKQAIESL